AAAPAGGGGERHRQGRGRPPGRRAARRPRCAARHDRHGRYEPVTASTLADVVAASSVIITAGSGGVGKTTTAASIALAGARAGRRVVVVTIDPARRLADALGLGPRGLTDEPQRIDGPWSGELWAA